MSSDSRQNDIPPSSDSTRRGSKRASLSDSELEPAGHSSNDWECADLGSSERQQKFLRLMGGKKKEHQGRFVVGEHVPEHRRSEPDETQLRHNLEDEYECSVQHKVTGGATGHSGLGFYAVATDVPTREEVETRETAEADPKVHSPNDWEHADLGDGDRRDKFLRLMGAGKSEHGGRFVIGDQQPKQSRSGERITKITQDLEDQFVAGVEARVSGKARSHTGLGFDGMGSTPASVQTAADSTTNDRRADHCSVAFVKGSST